MRLISTKINVDPFFKNTLAISFESLDSELIFCEVNQAKRTQFQDTETLHQILSTNSIKLEYFLIFQ
jgi:hypothetical protein